MLVLPILILLVAVVPSRVQQPPVAENPCSAEPSFCGTAIAFQSSLTATFQGARQTGKLVFLLHVSGHFEDSRFTWNNAEALRVGALTNEEVGKYMSAHYVSCFQKVGTFRIAAGQKQGGNVAGYFCTPDGSVLHILAGPVDADTFLREARWVIETHKLAELEARTNRTQLQALFRKAHAERLRHEHRHHAGALSVSSANPSAGDLAALLGQPEARRLNRQGQVHLLLASAPLVRIDRIYALVLEKILNERISTNPVASDWSDLAYVWESRGRAVPVGRTHPQPPGPGERDAKPDSG